MRFVSFRGRVSDSSDSGIAVLLCPAIQAMFVVTVLYTAGSYGELQYQLENFW